MKYRLKKGQERFCEVDGPFAGREYQSDAQYDEADIPPDKLKRFEKMKAQVVKPKPAGTVGKDAKKENVRQAPVKTSEGQS